MSRPARGGRETIKGSWSETEDKELSYLVEVHQSNWAKISEHMNGRTAKQCRERWIQNLRPGLNHGPILQAEGDFIMAQVAQIGQKWAEISRRIQEHGINIRSDNAVKNWYNGNRNREKRQVARRHRQSSTSARTRVAPPSPLNLGQQQRELPRPMTGTIADIRSPMTPIHGDYGYAAPCHPAHLSQTAFDRRPSSGPQLPPLHNALAQDRNNESHWQHSQQQHHHHHAQQHHVQHHHAQHQHQPVYHQQPMPQHNASYPYHQQRLPDRRPSVNTNAGSPRSEAPEYHYVPSLVSDTGSPPSARESPMHAPASPNTAVPSMTALPPLPPATLMSEKEIAAHGLQNLRYRRSSPTMVRSWSNRSDEQYQPLPQPQHTAQTRLPPPAPLEPTVLAYRPSSSGRASTSRSGMDLNNLLN